MADMTTLTTHTPPAAHPPTSTSHALDSPPAVEIVIPVYNEQRVLADNVRRLDAFLCRECDFSFRITIADNASTDATLSIAQELGEELERVHVLHLTQKGRGLALRTAWTLSDAEIVAYMDVDLSTDLHALSDLLAPLLNGTGDLAIGSRLAPGAEVTRGVKRELISRSYNLLLHWSLGVGFSDAQCGFKAGRREVVVSLLPLVADDRWFFDTELLYVAQRNRFSIHEVPVRWVDDPDSRVDIVATAREDLLGIKRLRGAEKTYRRRTRPRSQQALRLRTARFQPHR
jgi:glycosyltransferase involved in cell wall biosynthesis